MAQCVFCQTVAGTLGAEVIYEDDLMIAIADIYPIR